MAPPLAAAKTSFRRPFFFIFFTFLACFLGLFWCFLGISAKQEVLTEDRRSATQNLIEDYQTGLVSGNEIVYQSPSFGFSVRFDPRFWLPSAGTDFEQTNLDHFSLSLRPAYGAGMVSFSASAPNGLAEVKTKFGQTGETDAEALGLFCADRYRQYLDYELTDQERFSFGGQEASKLTLEKEFLGEKVRAFVYCVPANNAYYLIETNYPSSFSDAAGLVQDLLARISFFPPGSPAEAVKGAADESGAALLDEAKVVELVGPSVVNILHSFCAKITIPSGVFLKESYRICSANTGSGFLISNDGYLATNGHVVKSYPEEIMIAGIYYNTAQDFLLDLVREIVLSQTGATLEASQANEILAKWREEPALLDAVAASIYSLLEQNLASLTADGDKFFVTLGEGSFSLNQEKLAQKDYFNLVSVSETVREATLVSYDYPNFFSLPVFKGDEEANGSDVAILKLKDLKEAGYPGLKIGDSSALKEGSPILVIGFPGLVSGSGTGSSLLDYEASSGKSTITRGIVSALKSDKGGRKLIQTDASIEKGNSGGPAFNLAGEVVGIATYSVSGDGGNYNFLRDVADLQALMAKESLQEEESAVFQSWSSGLANFWGQYYKRSLPLFNKVQADYPIHPLVGDFIKEAEAAIADGKDKDLIFGLEKWLFFVLAGVFLFLVVCLAVWLVIRFLKKKKSRPLPPPAPSLPLSPSSRAVPPLVSPPPPPVQPLTSSSSSFRIPPPPPPISFPHHSSVPIVPPVNSPLPSEDKVAL